MVRISKMSDDESSNKMLYKCWYTAKGCKKCELCVDAQFQYTLGLGFNADSTSEIMFVGEAPGLNEWKYKIPFCGDSGKLLRSYIKDARLDDVSYITNVIKCRPINNRTPVTKEINKCAHHLDRELAMFTPRIIVLLGRVAKQRFNMEQYNIRKDIPIIVGSADTVLIVIAHHPSFVLRCDKKEHYNKLFFILKHLYHEINPNYLIDF